MFENLIKTASTELKKNCPIGGHFTDGGDKLHYVCDELPVKAITKEVVEKIKTPFRRGNPLELLKNFTSNDVDQYTLQINRFKKLLKSPTHVDNRDTYQNYINKLSKRLKVADLMKKGKALGRSFKPVKYNKSQIYILAKENGVAIKDIIKELKRKAIVDNPAIVEISKAIALNAVGEKDFNQEYASHKYEYMAEAKELIKSMPELQATIDEVEVELDGIEGELSQLKIKPIETINKEVVNSPVKTLVVKDSEPLSPVNASSSKAMSKVKNEPTKKKTDIKKVAMIGGGLLLAMQMFS